MTARTQHTPGPWAITDGPCGDARIVADGETVAVIYCGILFDTGHSIDPEGEANARLIASAPYLLVALERIAEHESRYQETASYREAVAAIARARGETK